jgi:hypothetical protein
MKKGYKFSLSDGFEAFKQDHFSGNHKTVSV